MNIKIETGIPIPAPEAAPVAGIPAVLEIMEALAKLEIGESFFQPYQGNDFEGVLASRMEMAIKFTPFKKFTVRKYPFTPPYNPPGIRVWRVSA